MLNWDTIETVLLDMDGTLLDLNFDRYFWQEHLPMRYAQQHGMELEAARQILFPKFRAVEGTITWYCLDYWSQELGLDISQLKAEVDHLIAIHPNVILFLDQLREIGKTTVLVTNAHYKSLTLKMERTSLDRHLDQIICAHEFGVPKEDPAFWGRLKGKLPFREKYTLLIDDSLPVLRSAERYGITHLLTLFQPDSQNTKRDVGEFRAIHGFADILPSPNAV